jgi:DNA polymerase-3 subunit gamma/tau
VSSYTVFARKYRPQTFADVLGQEHITRTLSNAIQQGRIAHAYIFVGPRGTGKTSTARIFAKALNCTGGPKADFDPNDPRCLDIVNGRSLDVIEIDGASNNGVENIRDLREKVQSAPAHSRYKIYIIDEVHMLSTAAFNALLKTLEEPPDHVIFLMATTDVQKVLPTILSRCQRFDLKRIPTATIAKHLLYIAGNEGFTLDPAAAEAVARGAEGGLRDAESMLDQLVGFCGNHITEQDVLDIFGFTATQAIANLCETILQCDSSGALHTVHDQAEQGKDLARLMSDLIGHLRNLLVVKADPLGLDEELMPDAVESLKAQAEGVPMEKLLDLIEQLATAESRMKWAPNKKMHIEVAVIRAIQTLNTATLTEVLDTLTALRGGAAPAPRSAPPARPPITPKPTPPRAAPRTFTPAPAPVTPPTPVVDKTAPPAPEPAPAPVAKPEPTPAVSEVVIKTPEPVPVPQPQSTERPPWESATECITTPEPAPAQPKTAEEIWAALLQAGRDQLPGFKIWAELAHFGGIEGDDVAVFFTPDQTLAREHWEESANLKKMHQWLEEIAGRPLRLRIGVREIAPAEPEVKRDPMEEFKDDPLIRKALELFRGQLQLA